MNATKILAIIPCYNESASIEKLLKEFVELNLGVDILVIDDGSKDATADIAKKYANFVIIHEKNKGVPAAIKTGILYAIDNGYDYCVQIDGDGQHPPAEIRKFASVISDNAIKNNFPNLLVGSRYYARGFLFAMGLRKLGGLFISVLIYILFGRWFSDAFSGMRMMDKKAMKLFAQKIDNNFIDAFILPTSITEKLDIAEVPVQMRNRQAGRSYVAGLKGVKFMLRLTWKILLLRIRKN